MGNCIACGAEHAADARFCERCGARVADGSPSLQSRQRVVIVCVVLAIVATVAAVSAWLAIRHSTSSPTPNLHEAIRTALSSSFSGATPAPTARRVSVRHTQIHTVQISGAPGSYSFTIDGAGFGPGPAILPYRGALPNFRIGDPSVSLESGHTGDALALTYERWSDTEIQVSGWSGSAGDAVAIEVWNSSTNDTATWGGNAQPVGRGAAQVSSVAFSGSGEHLHISVRGAGFGAAPSAMPFTGLLDAFSFGDASAGNGFGAGHTGNEVSLIYRDWTDSDIEIDGFSGAYGENGMAVQAGDAVSIVVHGTASQTVTAWGGWLETGSVRVPTPAAAAPTQASAPASWSAPQPIASRTYFTSVSCPSERFCAAVGRTGAPGTFGGQAVVWQDGAWLTPSAPTALGSGSSFSVSCPADDECLTVSSDGYVSWLSQGAWSPPQQLYQNALGAQNRRSVTAVSCATPTFCVAVANDGSSLIWDGAAWASPQQADSAGLRSVSCPSPNFCAASGFSDHANIWDGAAWSGTPRSPVQGLSAISCATRTFCMEAGGVHATGDIASVWDGRAWSPLFMGPRDAPVGFDALSCPTATFCAAADGGAGRNGVPSSGRGPALLVWDGSSWSAPAVLAPVGLQAISCASPSFCVAVDGAGNALTWR
jgi:hypothetical protein